mmetsp:Transcript_131274/g.419966  ORF Transcript_131274/g.419966 Transcript_131274/m.419966 type:complete len:370 (+) Transcript_131274:208-1317(+)
MPSSWPPNICGCVSSSQPSKAHIRNAFVEPLTAQCMDQSTAKHVCASPHSWFRTAVQLALPEDSGAGSSHLRSVPSQEALTTCRPSASSAKPDTTCSWPSRTAMRSGASAVVGNFHTLISPLVVPAKASESAQSTTRDETPRTVLWTVQSSANSSRSHILSMPSCAPLKARRAGQCMAMHNTLPPWTPSNFETDNPKSKSQSCSDRSQEPLMARLADQSAAMQNAGWPGLIMVPTQMQWSRSHILMRQSWEPVRALRVDQSTSRLRMASPCPLIMPKRSPVEMSQRPREPSCDPESARRGRVRTIVAWGAGPSNASLGNRSSSSSGPSPMAPATPAQTRASSGRGMPASAARRSLISPAVASRLIRRHR